jgi:hypothetical protein
VTPSALLFVEAVHESSGGMTYNTYVLTTRKFTYISFAMTLTLPLEASPRTSDAGTSLGYCWAPAEKMPPNLSHNSFIVSVPNLELRS